MFHTTERLEHIIFLSSVFLAQSNTRIIARGKARVKEIGEAYYNLYAKKHNYREVSERKIQRMIREWIDKGVLKEVTKQPKTVKIKREFLDEICEITKGLEGFLKKMGENNARL